MASTDHREDQALEVEALQSLYVNGELEIIDAESFRLSLSPSSVLEEGKKCYVSLVLFVKYTQKYPDEEPEWKLEEVKGLDDEQLENIRSLVENVIGSSLGMPMIYDMAETITSFLNGHNYPPVSMHDEMMKIQRQNRSNSSKDAKRDELTGNLRNQIDSDSDGDDDDSDYVDDGSGSDDVGENSEEDEQYGRQSRKKGSRRPKPTGAFQGLQQKELCAADQRVTEKEFLSWTEMFRKEMVDGGNWKGSATCVANSILSGRKLFEIDHSLVNAEGEGVDEEGAGDELNADGTDNSGIYSLRDSGEGNISSESRNRTASSARTGSKNRSTVGESSGKTQSQVFSTANVFWSDANLFEGEDADILLEDE